MIAGTSTDYEVVAREDFSDVTYLLEVRHPLMARAAQPGQFVIVMAHEHGERIPLTARIFAIVDVWDALTSERPYRPAWTEEKAVEYIKSQSGTHFDPDIVGRFLNVIDGYHPF